MDNIKIGKLIAKLRKNKGYSQKELAEKLEVSPKTISKWECGNGLPDISILKKVSEILDITIEELLEGTLKNQSNTLRLKNNKIKYITITILFIMFIIVMYNIYLDNSIKDNNCTVIKTYYIDNIDKSNDENYLYVTLHEFQIEGTYTIKLSKLIAHDLEVGGSYEFTFKTKKDSVIDTTDTLFDNSKIINIEYTDKIGLDRTNIFFCDKK